MKYSFKVISATLLCLCSSLTCASPEYLKRFEIYRYLSTHLDDEHAAEIRSFIKEDKPLSHKLQNRWLYYLAKQQQFADFLKDFKDTDDDELLCYQGQAFVAEGDSKQASDLAKRLWLHGRSMPKACDALFEWFKSTPDFTESLITERIQLALERRNLQLARYLLKLYKNPRKNDATTLFRLYHNPGLITKMQTGDLHDDFYLYGLKRLVSKNMDEAIRYFRHASQNKLLTKPQRQKFLAHVALYKAMRQHIDADQWFKKVKPEFYNDLLLDWAFRNALRQKKWKQVEYILKLKKDNDAPDNQYWLARAYEAQGHQVKAKSIYQSLATMRHYYGFLASQRLQKPLAFEDASQLQTANLKDYQPVLDEIEALYRDNKRVQASRLLNDFRSELPKDEQIMLASWVSDHLNWYGKSVYLSNNDELHDELALRFPLAHRHIVKQQSRQNKVKPEYIYAIIRQESAFRDQVVSHAGARGLMQLMPKTAQQVARKNKIGLNHLSELFVPAKNITLGVGYLSMLAQQFNQHPALMAAAYNAGPYQVKSWLKRHQPEEIDIWIENIPWHETRNYLKNVMAFYAVYQYRLKQKPDISSFLKPIMGS